MFNMAPGYSILAPRLFTVPKVTPLFPVSCWAHAISTAHWGPRDLCHFTFPCIRSVFLFSFECITIFKYCSSSTAATTTCGDHPCAVYVFLPSSHGF